MIPYSEALQIIEGHARKLSVTRGTVKEPLLRCVGRCSAGDIAALDDNPRFDNSAMDGFALSASKTTKASRNSPVRLNVLGTLSAGEKFSGAATGESDCIEIMTGSKMPESPYDAVVRLEDVTQERNASGHLTAISLYAPVEPGENVRFKGDDFRRGDTLLSRGTKIGPEHLLALSMVGCSSLEAYLRPKVALFSSGNEIVPFDSTEISPEQIRNSTAPLLCSALESYGCDVTFCGIVKDDEGQIRRMMYAALELKPDIIISTGGVSVGKYDLVDIASRECGAKVFFHKAAVRPGKPVLFGEFGPAGTAFFGLPGNPIAVAAATRFFVKPYLRSLLGEKPERPHTLPLNEDVRKPAGLSFFQRGVRDGQGVKALSGQASFMASSLVKAEGWIVGVPEPDIIKKGELVGWYPLW